MMTILKPVAIVMIGSLCWNSSFASLAKAKEPAPLFLNAEDILNVQSDLRTEITQSLNDKQILSELSKMGIGKKEVEMRLAAMSDNELKQIQTGVQRTAGGDVIVVSTVTLLLGIIILILLLK